MSWKLVLKHKKDGDIITHQGSGQDDKKTLINYIRKGFAIRVSVKESGGRLHVFEPQHLWIKSGEVFAQTSPHWTIVPTAAPDAGYTFKDPYPYLRMEIFDTQGRRHSKDLVPGTSFIANKNKTTHVISWFVDVGNSNT